MTVSDRESGRANTMESRADRSRFGFAVLLRAHRLVLTGVLAAVVFGTFVFAVSVLRPPFVQQLQSGDTIETLFSTMIGVIVTGTTLVVSIGQLVLTQENGPLGDQRDRMSGTMDFRGFTREVTGQPSPTDPAEFLDGLVTATITRSEALRDGVDETRGGVDEDLTEFADGVIDNARSVSNRLAGAEFGSFEVVSAALDFNYGRKIGRIEQFQSDDTTELDDADSERLDELRMSLSMFAPAREHIKTLYFQYELIVLSQRILYAAIPALVVAGIMTAVVAPGTVSGTLYGIEQITLLVGAAFTVTLLPFLLFVSYILRILTVAKRTLAIGPLVLHD